MGMAGLGPPRSTEHGGDVVVTFNVRLLGEIQVAAVGLAFPGKGRLQISSVREPFNRVIDLPYLAISHRSGTADRAAPEPVGMDIDRVRRVSTV